MKERAPHFALAMLILLYTLQGIPLGLALGSIPFLLKAHTTSYTTLGLFSLASYPYSLKLLWSPIVDSIYSNSFGRRKSWIIPIQTIVGIMFISGASTIEQLVNNADSRTEVVNLTLIFFFVVVLVATQDIAVDGWALSLLDGSNRGLSSTAQSIGLNLGYFTSFTVFLAFNSPDFCNTYVRSFYSESLDSSSGIISLESYLVVSGIAMLLTSFGLLFVNERLEEDTKLSYTQTISSTYIDIVKILNIPSMRWLLVILLTTRVGFAAADNVTLLKLIEYGLPKEMVAASVLVTFPFEIIFPIVIGRISVRSPHKSLGPFMMGYPLRIGVSIVGTLLAAYFKTSSEITTRMYIMVILVQVLYSLSMNLMFTSQCAFFSRIADESIGGTYMTLLNTVANLGNTWPKIIVMILVDFFTTKECNGIADDCAIAMDGYYIVAFLCIIVSIVWYATMKPRLLMIQATKQSIWRVSPGTGSYSRLDHTD